MSRVTAVQQNFSGGELSQTLNGRFDLGVFYNGASWLQNFIATVQGMARFRSGSKFVWNSRDNGAAILIPFEYNTEQSYVLEFGNLYMRIIKDGGIVTQAPQAITAITQANPAVVTYVGADYANGQRVILSGVEGMLEINNQEYVVANVNAGANTFELQGVNSSGFDAYTSGGTVAQIVEVVTTYTEAELFDLDYSQTTDTMYIVHASHAPAKLTRSSHTAWTLANVAFIANPFGTTQEAEAAKNITAITKANPAVVTSNAHGFVNGDRVRIAAVVGMTEVNGLEVLVAGVTANTFQLQGVNSTNYTTYVNGGTASRIGKDISAITKANPAVVTSNAHGYSNGDTVYIEGIVGMAELNKRWFTIQNVAANTFQLQSVDSTAYTAYTSGGTVSRYTEFSYPSKLTFFEKRLIYGASNAFPQTIWGSVGGEYENFNAHTGASDAFKYTLASGQANRIRWMAATEDFLAIGTAGSEFKAEGGNNEAITPTNISIKPPSYYGSANVRPIRLDSHIMYIQRDSITTRTFEFDAIQDGFTSINRNLTADTILEGRYGKPSGVKQVAFQSGSPSINWMVRNDGIMVGLTFEPREQVNGWHRHLSGGHYDGGKLRKPEYESVCTISQAAAPDAVYQLVKRTIEGQTVRYIEYFADQPKIPRFNDYYTGDQAADKDAYLQDLWEAQKRLWFVDSGISLDGSVDEGLDLAFTEGDGITVIATGAVFSATDVGREIWGKEGGRAVIVTYVDTDEVVVNITKEFNNLVLQSDGWYLTFRTIRGLEHLEGENVVALVDGGVVEDLVVEDGTIVLANQASYVIIGLQYLGIYQSMDIEGGGDNGPGVTKEKSVSQVGVKFLNTLGCLVGTDLYKLDRVTFRTTANLTSRPPPLFSGVKMVGVRDSWTPEKYIYCVQDKPLPCNIQLLAPRLQTNDG